MEKKNYPQEIKKKKFVLSKKHFFYNNDSQKIKFIKIFGFFYQKKIKKKNFFFSIIGRKNFTKIKENFFFFFYDILNILKKKIISFHNFFSFYSFFFNFKNKNESNFINLNSKDSFFLIVAPMEIIEKISKNKNLIWINSKNKNHHLNFLNISTISGNKLFKVCSFYQNQSNFANFYLKFFLNLAKFFNFDFSEESVTFSIILQKKYKKIFEFFSFLFFTNTAEFLLKNFYFINNLLHFCFFFIFNKIVKKKNYFNLNYRKKVFFFIKDKKIFSIYYIKTKNKKFLKEKKRNLDYFNLKKHFFLKKIIRSEIFFFFSKSLNKKKTILYKKKNLKKKTYLFLELDNIFMFNHFKNNKRIYKYYFDLDTVFLLLNKNKRKLTLEKKNYAFFDMHMQKNWIFFLQNYYSRKNYFISFKTLKITIEKKNFYSIIDSFLVLSNKINIFNFIIFGNFLNKFSQITKVFGSLELRIIYQINIKIHLGNIINSKKNLIYLMNLYHFLRKKKTFLMTEKVISINLINKKYF